MLNNAIFVTLHFSVLSVVAVTCIATFSKTVNYYTSGSFNNLSVLVNFLCVLCLNINFGNFIFEVSIFHIVV